MFDMVRRISSQRQEANVESAPKSGQIIVCACRLCPITRRLNCFGSSLPCRCACNCTQLFDELFLLYFRHLLQMGAIKTHDMPTYPHSRNMLNTHFFLKHNSKELCIRRIWVKAQRKHGRVLCECVFGNETTNPTTWKETCTQE